MLNNAPSNAATSSNEEPATASAPKPQRQASPTRGGNSADDAFAQNRAFYTDLIIAAPSQEQTLENPQNQYIVIQVKPRLALNDRIDVYLDGDHISSGSQTRFKLPWLKPGKHRLTVKLRSDSGKTYRNAQSSFFVR